MNLIPPRFLVRVCYPIPLVKGIPSEEGDRLLDLPEHCRLNNFATAGGPGQFADVRVAWNEFGLGVQVEVRGKDKPPQGSAERPRASDGVSLWIDTRDARTSHRASRYCHQFHLLPAGSGTEGDEPVFTQAKINRALQDAPQCNPSEVPFRVFRVRSGYGVEVFLPATTLYGFDPEQNPRLGFFYSVRDTELGEQVLSVGAEFPYWEDPSLWEVLELVRPAA